MKVSGPMYEISKTFIGITPFIELLHSSWKGQANDHYRDLISVSEQGTSFAYLQSQLAIETTELDFRSYIFKGIS